jgi:hypothetical protein
MRSMIYRLFPKTNYDALLPAAVGFFIIYVFTRHSGIGISPDSVVYMSVARNIHEHGLLIDFNERPLVVFPSFYPVFLSSLIFITGFDPMVFAPWLNAFLFAMIIYLSGLVMEGFSLRSKWYKYIVLSCIVLSPCLLEIYSMLWSETLFILLLLIFIISLRNYFNAHSIQALLLVAVIAALSCVTRYAGITIIATGGLLLLFDNKLQVKKKIGHIILFGCVASSLLVINLVRNAIIDGTSTGMREKSLTSLSNNIYYFGNTLCDWLPIPRDHFALAFAVGIISIAGFILLFLRSIRKPRFYGYENISVAFFMVYSLFIILTATFSRYELINSRLLSPLFIPLLWGSSSWALSFFRNKPQVIRISVIVISLLFVLFFQHYQVKAGRENYDGIKDAGIPGYTEDPWRKNSEIVNFLKKNTQLFKPGYNVYSNSDDALYFFTGLRCDMVPHKVFAQEISDFFIEPNCYLVWFDDTENPELIGLDDVLQHKKMVLLYQFTNGSIYVTIPNPPMSVKK